MPYSLRIQNLNCQYNSKNTIFNVVCISPLVLKNNKTYRNTDSALPLYRGKRMTKKRLPSSWALLPQAADKYNVLPGSAVSPSLLTKYPGSRNEDHERRRNYSREQGKGLPNNPTLLTDFGEPYGAPGRAGYI